MSTLPDSEWTQALVEQRIAEMSDQEFAEMCQRTRPPEPPTSNLREH
jgi:hypothetical protein